jgi:hypothetical protein
VSDSTIGCDDCVFGDVSHYFCNHEKRTLRIDCTYCQSCYPNSTGVVGCNHDEVEITIEEFTALCDAGYTELE